MLDLTSRRIASAAADGDAIQSGEPILRDFEPRTRDVRDVVVRGLSKRPKSLPSKLFYDEIGSRLFDRICELDEYYLTRTELAITRAHAAEISAALGPRCRLVELGSGSSVKTEILLDHLEEPAVYMPVDISRDHLLATARRLARAYPRVPMRPICADYSEPLPALPALPPFERTIVYFPGSTIGNFERDEARAFLRRMRRLCGDAGGLLIGVDLVKDGAVLHRAYNDRDGVTAAFNLNVLARLNRELDADFDLGRFRHRAFWDAAHARIEMQLVSTVAQTAHVAGIEVAFAAGEAITTEYSHKYALPAFAELARRAGFAVERVWTDPARWFSVQYCETV